jgi:putative ABC transport system permease protein
MNLPTLALKNTFRNRTRALLTIGGVAVLTLAFVFLRTVIGAYYSGSEQSHSDRLIVRNRVSLAQPLPLAYFEKIKAVPGVDLVTYSSWFGGVYIDQRHFFGRFAVDPSTYPAVYKDVQVTPEDVAAFQADRTGALVGSALAKKYDFKRGDQIKLKGDIYPGDWNFKVEGVYTSPNAFADSAMLFQWKYLDEGAPDALKGKVGTFAVNVKDAAQSPQIGKAIDALFANSANETVTESEQTFMLGFVTGLETIIDALQAVSVVLLIIMLLILGNTLAMAVRERTSELAVLRTLGFRPGQLHLLALAEGFWLSLFGGLLGAAIAWKVTAVFLRQVNGFLGAGVADHWTLPALGIAVAAGLLAAELPALQAARIDIVAGLRRAE